MAEEVQATPFVAHKVYMKDVANLLLRRGVSYLSEEKNVIGFPGIIKLLDGKSSCKITTMRLSTGKASPGKNLTGNPRLVRDLAADIHSCVQKWNSAHLQGVSILTEISRIVIANEGKGKDAPNSNLQELCDDLEKVCDALDTVVESLEILSNQMKTIRMLQKPEQKLFVTWPTEKFGQVAERIHEAYREESKVKRTVLENAAHESTESWQMLHLAAWTHQPMIPDNLNTVLETLLRETGHR